MPDIRRLSPQQRTADLYFHIDPWGLDLAKCFSAFGAEFTASFKNRTDPDDGPSGLDDHQLVDLALQACRDRGVTTLAQQVSDPQVGSVFCSVEKMRGDETAHQLEQVRFPLVLPYDCELHIELQIETQHIVDDAGSVLLSRESDVALIGEISEVSGQSVLVSPLIFGSPTFDHPRNSDFDVDLLTWYALNIYEVLPDDLSPFARLATLDDDPELNEWMPYMEQISDEQLQATIRELLRYGNDPATKEHDSLEVTSLDYHGRRIDAAFLFTGGSPFCKLTPDMLGNAGDQIPLLAESNADLLVVHHRHSIDKAVHDTLRAITLAPHHPRRYCLIDGQITYKLFKAYGKL